MDEWGGGGGGGGGTVHYYEQHLKVYTTKQHVFRTPNHNHRLL